MSTTHLNFILHFPAEFVVRSKDLQFAQKGSVSSRPTGGGGVSNSIGQPVAPIAGKSDPIPSPQSGTNPPLLNSGGSGSEPIPRPQNEAQTPPFSNTSGTVTYPTGISSGNSSLLGDLPLIFLLSFVLFFIANTLLIKSGRLLRSISLIRDDLFTPDEKHFDELKVYDGSTIFLLYFLVVGILAFNRILRFHYFYSPEEIFSSLLSTVFTDPDAIAPVFFLLALAPAAIAMINFVMSAAISARLRTIPQSPSPVIGLFGALLSLISMLGSLAGIWRVYIEIAKN